MGESLNMKKTAVFTIASLNYLAHVRSLMESVNEHNNNVDTYLLLVDDTESINDYYSDQFTTVLSKDIGIDSFEKMAFKYNIMEFNTSVKPFFISYLFEKKYEKVIYFDPDIYVYNSLDNICALLDDHNVVLTPHITSEMPCDGKIPNEEVFLQSGTFNLGFFAISKSEKAISFIRWWQSRLASKCYRDEQEGLFVDQKWINLIHCFLDRIHVLKDKGCNVAYWNFHERIIDEQKIDGDDLVFFHFSGFCFDDIDRISKYQDRYRLSERADLYEYFEAYRERLIDNGYCLVKNLEYKYSRFDNDMIIPPAIRKVFAFYEHEYETPFDTGPHSFFEMVQRKKYLSSGSFHKPSVDSVTRYEVYIKALLRFLMKVIGLNRYYNLMRYMKKIISLRKQKFLFD